MNSLTCCLAQVLSASTIYWSEIVSAFTKWWKFNHHQSSVSLLPFFRLKMQQFFFHIDSRLRLKKNSRCVFGDSETRNCGTCGGSISMYRRRVLGVPKEDVLTTWCLSCQFAKIILPNIQMLCIVVLHFFHIFPVLWIGSIYCNQPSIQAIKPKSLSQGRF